MAKEASYADTGNSKRRIGEALLGEEGSSVEAGEAAGAVATRRLEAEAAEFVEAKVAELVKLAEFVEAEAAAEPVGKPADRPPGRSRLHAVRTVSTLTHKRYLGEDIEGLLSGDR